MGLACNGLKQGLGSQPVTALGCGGKSIRSYARPVVSDKGPGFLALQKRIPTRMECSEASIYWEEKEYSTCG